MSSYGSDYVRMVLSLSPHQARTHGVKEREHDDVGAPKRTLASLFHACSLLTSARFLEPGAVRGALMGRLVTGSLSRVFTDVHTGDRP